MKGFRCILCILGIVGAFFACQFDAVAANCTNSPEGGKFCKGGVKYPCRPGCYCEGSTKGVGGTNVRKACKDRDPNKKATLEAAGVFYCPDSYWGETDEGMASKPEDCYRLENGNKKNYGSVSCDVGYYLPLKSETCVACPEQYRCPGSENDSEATDNKWNFSSSVNQGNYKCIDLRPNQDHTACQNKVVYKYIDRTWTFFYDVNSTVTLPHELDGQQFTGFVCNILARPFKAGCTFPMQTWQGGAVCTGFVGSCPSNCKVCDTTYTITYNNMDDAGWDAGQNHPDSYTPGTATTIGVPTRANYTFRGWCVNNANCSNYMNNAHGYTIPENANGNYDLYAKWMGAVSNTVQNLANNNSHFIDVDTPTDGGGTQTTTYSVTYTCGDGTGTAPVDNIPHESGSDVTVPTAYETLATGFGGCVGPADRPRLDYWDCGNNGHVNPGGTFTVNANTTCIAKWDFVGTVSVGLQADWNPNQHRIYRCRQIGAYLDSQATLPMSINANHLSNNNIPTREGYTFAGYYTQSQGNADQPVGTKYIDSNGYITAEGINAARWSDTFNLYAGWIRNNPDNPDNPNNPETPDNPTDPDPVNPAEPDNPNNPETPDNPTDPDPVNPAEPEDPDPVNPVDPDPIITPVGPGTNGTTVACAAGKYLPKNGNSSADCANCESGYFCPRDGNYVAGASVAQGRWACLPGGVQNSDRKSCRVVLDKSQLLYGLNSGEECWQKTNTDDYVECMMRDVHMVE